MKKNIFGLSLCAVALSGLLAVSCSTEYTYVDVVADVPTITVSPVTLSADAGTYSFYYSVANAASDATVSCTADVSWISNLDASVVGTVYFAVDENTADELRTGNVTLTYAYEDGAVTAKVGVIQYGQTTPILEVDPNAVTAATDGGTYSFDYSIYDGYDDGELTCSSDVDWISDYDYSTYGTVSFTVAASEVEALRSATITVTYAYSGTSISKEVTVIQDRHVPTPPVLTVHPTTVSAAHGGGSSSFTYSLSNPADDGTLSCSADASWVSGFDYSTDGTVSFTVASNTSDDYGRDCEITVTYTYNGGSDSISKTVAVYQCADVSGIIGTYTAAGFVNGQGYSLQNTTWTLKIYAYTETDGYDVYVEGILPYTANTYSSYGYYCCVYGRYTDGKIVIPSQCSSVMQLTTSSASYYMGFTPCVEYSNNSFYYDVYYPDLTFTGDASTGAWESDYGMFLCGCTKEGDITSMYTYFQVVAPTIKLTKTASTTSVSSTGVTHSIMENLSCYNNFKAK